MSNESKRIFALVVGAMVWFFAAQILGERLGLFPKPKPKPPVEAARVEATPDDPQAPAAAEGAAQPQVAPAPEVAKVEPVRADDLILGSSDANSPYRLRVALDQKGAGIDTVDLSRHEAERIGKGARGPLRLVSNTAGTPPSFALASISVQKPGEQGETSWKSYPVSNRLWEVVRDAKGQASRPVLDAKGEEIGREVVFRTAVADPPVTVTKTFRLRKDVDGLELALAFESPKAEQKIYYRLNGPHGLPLEGEWYRSSFRDVFFGLGKGPRETQVETRTAGDLVTRQNDPETFLSLPLRYAGVEDQYFACFFEPEPIPEAAKDRIDDESTGLVIAADPKEKLKSDVSVAMTSREIALAPGEPAEQKFRIFAGPKTTDVLTPFGAADLAIYRKAPWYFRIPFAATLAQGVIAPLLDRIYGVTASVAHAFGGKRGNYGIAIILLTITVRLLLFPISRKLAISSKKMQDLQPKLTELKEKYKDDKETFAKEQWALFRKNGVNPVGGCLPAMIQMPIFVGLWQALNNSVALRHAPFLWIDNLAAPDMLFRLPVELPILGKYFNLLPFAVVGLMLVQMKMFTPPATTPEQEMSQKMMKFMMVFMSFMFYKVPSGLGLYFITSSTWAIGERLLLPKMIKSKPLNVSDEDGADGRGNGARLPRGSGGGNGNGADSGPKPGGFRDKLRQLVEEAQKDRTVRNDERDWGRGGGKPRPKPPGRKR